MVLPPGASAGLQSEIGVEVRGARLDYEGRSIFRDLDLELPAGTWTCLLGPSGVGKSSLLRLLAGISPEATATRLAASDAGPLAGRVAYMDQQDLLLPWLDVLGNATLGARLRGEPVDETGAGALLREVGLSDSAHLRPAALSGGMRQRTALARTLMERRPVVLMDEPFSAVDALTRLRLQDLAARLLAGRTVLLVTHDPLEALRLGHRVLVMRGAPARLAPAPTPAETPPRDPRSPELQAGVGALLEQLAATGAAA